MREFWKRSLSLLLALVLFMGVLPTITLQASAATKIVSQSAVDDFVKSAKAAIGKEKSELSLPAGDWCGYFVGLHCFNNSQIKSVLGKISEKDSAACCDPVEWALQKGAGRFYVTASGKRTKANKDIYYTKLASKKFVGSSEHLVKGAHTPKAGDIVLFDWGGDGSFYHVGVMTSATEFVHGNFGSSAVVKNKLSDGYDYKERSSGYTFKEYVIGYFSFNTCSHSKRNELGICTDCKEAFPLEHDANDAGIYKISPNLPWLVAMRKTPYAAAEKVKDIWPLSEVKVSYSAWNGDGSNKEKWMYATCDKVTGWINSNDLKFDRALDSKITFSGLKNPGKLTLKSGWPVVGTITSQYALVSVYGELWSVDGKTMYDRSGGELIEKKTKFDIYESDVNDDLNFGELPKAGYYYYKIIATDVKGKTSIWPDDIEKSTFQVGNPTQSTCATPKVEKKDIDGGKEITIKTATSGATLVWSINGGKEVSGKAPVTLKLYSDTQITVRAKKSGMKDSGKYSDTIRVSQCAMPTIEIGAMTSAGRQVSVRSSEPVELYYSINGQNFQKFTSAFHITQTANVRAYAVRKGYINSETAMQEVSLTAPSTPKVRLVSTEQNIASGRPITVMWDKDANATNYKVERYFGDELVETKYLTATSYTFATSAEGVYKVHVTASNVAGSSTAGVSPVVTAHAPSTVQFFHEDGTLLSEQQVEYGENAVAPETVPHKEGHTFTGWSRSLDNITNDTGIYAKFKINTYTVRFYDCNGETLLDTQHITYGSGINSAEMEKLVTLDTGYAFVGWHIRDAASNSRMDLDFVDCNMSLVATQQWEIGDLPIVVEITDAKRNAECTGYDVDLALTCAPADVVGGNTQKAKVIVSLKTADQTLAVAVETVNLTEETQNLSRSIFISYDGSNLAEVVSATVLGVDGNDRTGGQLAKTAYRAPKPVENWSAWSTNEPPAGVKFETKTQYRYQDSSRATTTRETTSTTAPVLSGWEVVGAPAERWSAWSAWSDTKFTKTNTRDVNPSEPILVTAGYTEYRYGRWTNGKMTCFCPVAGKDFYGGTWKQEETGWTKTRYTKLDGHYYCGGNTSKDGHINQFKDKDGDDSWYGYVKKGSADENKNRYYWEKTRTIDPVYKYQYQYRDKIFTYTYQKWTTGNWSAWSDTVYTKYETTNSRRAVETRTLYRYVTNDTSVTELENKTELYAFEGALTGENVGDYSGKLATVLVYKQVNSDPTEPQMESIGQIEMGEGNYYSFDLCPKEEPTTATGDFIVALALQGSSNVVNIGKIYAPAEEFKVTFYDHDGNVLEEHLVEEGEAATAPELPELDGYRFVCWNNDLTCVERDMSVFPVYVSEEYSVVFVDHENETVELKTDYVYGDALLTPDTPSCEGMNFIGWQITYNTTGETKLLENVSAVSEDVEGEIIEVTDDLIVTAVWEPIMHAVTFYNHDGSVLQEQTVAHGSAAELPTEITVPEGMVSLGWSTDVQWWNVTEDLSVMPIVVYEETTAAPSTDEFEYIGLMKDIELVSEDGAVIYYTMDGSDPEPGQDNTFIYSEPIHVEEDTCVRAMATKENKNVSEIVEVSFWYMDGMEDYPVEDTLLVGNYNIQVEPDTTVQLQMNIENNPGLVAYMFYVDANTNVFSIPTNVETGETTCTTGNICSNGVLLVGDYEDDLGWPVLWYGTEAAEGNGNLCNITLQVSEEAEAGTYPVTVHYSPANTFDEEYVTQELPGLSAGFSGASEFKMGDVDGDGMVTNKDVVLTARWIIGAVQIAEERQFLIDVNNDGSKTMADVLHMARYVVGLEHVLGGLG